MADTEDYSTLQDRARKKLERDMGPLLMTALSDPRTVDIMLNADQKKNSSRSSRWNNMSKPAASHQGNARS